MTTLVLLGAFPRVDTQTFPLRWGFSKVEWGTVSQDCNKNGTKKGESMICPHCERYLEDGVAFCIYCGQRLGKYAPDDASEGSRAFNLNDTLANPLDSSATTSFSPVAAAGTAAAAGAAATAAAPVAPASAQEGAPSSPSGRTGRDFSRPSVSGRNRGETGRLHSDDEIAKRMNQLDDGQKSGRGRKVLGGILLAGLAAAAIGVGATQLAPTILDVNPGSSSSQVSSATSDSSSASSKGSSSSSTKSGKSSSASAKDGKSSKSGNSGNNSSNVETKRGSTLERANSDGNNNGGNTAANTETVPAVPTTGDEVSTGIVNTYTPSSNQDSSAPVASNGNGGGLFAGATASATSISPQEGSVTHGPELVLDGDSRTAWNTNLSGVDQSITLKLGKKVKVKGLRIMNGYNKISGSGTDLYWANARAKKILVEVEGKSYEFKLKDKKGKFQKLKFGKSVKTSWVKITIKSVYAGNLYDDCCISEVKVY